MIRFRTDPPDVTAFDNSKNHSWAMTAHGEKPEEIPSDAPEQLGKESVLTHCFDANLMHNVVDRKAVTGCLHLLKQDTAEAMLAVVGTDQDGTVHPSISS